MSSEDSRRRAIRQDEVFRVQQEFERQDARWGPQFHPDGTGREVDRTASDAVRALTDRAADAGNVTWRHVLEEEVFEAFAESDPVALVGELEQVAAVAIQWATAVRLREGL